MSKKQLHEFEGREVVGTTIVLTNTGDGLSKAVAVENVEILHGQKVYLVIEAEAEKVRFDKSKDDPSKLIRVQILKGGTISIVDFKLVAEVLTRQEEANDKLAARAKIPFDKDINKPGDWETPERLPGAPAPIGDLAKQAVKKAGAKKAAAPRTPAEPKDGES